MFDTAIVGLGAMGSAAAAHLASRGAKVLGLEQFGPAHDRGSSHGDSRMIRQAYFEDPAYVPLLKRSYELWGELEKVSPGVFTVTGGLMVGSQTSRTISGSISSAEQWDLPYELLSADEIRHRFPTMTPGPEDVGFYEHRSGFIRPEQAVIAHHHIAREGGADLRFHDQMHRWVVDDDGTIRITSTSGEHTARHLVITPGAWAPRLLAELDLPLVVERQVLYWFRPVGGVEPFAHPGHPVFMWEDATGRQVYGFPALDGPAGGVKVAFFRGGATTTAETIDRTVHRQEIDAIRTHLRERIPGLAGEYLRGVTCMYTNTPDENFLVDTHPKYPNVTVAAGFSGHGFKFAPVIGEVLADISLEGSTSHSVSMFSADRLGGAIV